MVSNKKGNCVLEVFIYILFSDRSMSGRKVAKNLRPI